MERPFNDGRHANVYTYNDFYIAEHSADTV